MSQNVSSRRQELLSRLKTTLAIVSQATGFDNDRFTSDARPLEQQQFNSTKDPRIRKVDTYPEGSRVAEPADGAASSSGVPANTTYRKFEEIQDEDEFLYGSSVSGAQQVSGSKRIDDLQVEHLRNTDQQGGHLQWASQRAREEEAPQWSTSLQSAVHRDVSSRWMGDVEPPVKTRQPMSEQSQWMQSSSQRSGEQSWRASSVQTMGYYLHSDVSLV